MIIRPLSVSRSIQEQNHRQPHVLRALRWFWRFSQFYGDYAVRSPREKQDWINEQQAK
ncbi:MAG: hypothetical protein AAGB19_08940 [Cyanobacteria bacterium P01_F01_bin.3]